MKSIQEYGRKVVSCVAGFSLVASACGGGSARDTEARDPLLEPSGFAAGGDDGPQAPGVNESPDDSIEPSSVVGSLSGQRSVGENGAFTYQIPIQVQPGKAGLTPGFSLNYDSLQGTAMLGKGWSLGGQSAIGRCPGAIPLALDALYNDILVTENFAVLWNELNPFHSYQTLCLDGALLYPRSTEAGEPNSTAPEFGIVGRPSTVVYANFPGGLNSPGEFRVEQDDGTISTYSEGVAAGEDGAGGDLTRRWALTRRADRSGNEIHYIYQSTAVPSAIGDTDGNHRLASVEYQGGRVEFQYSADPTGEGSDPRDHRVQFWKGARAENEQYLSSIHVFGANDGLARSYALDYERSVFSGDLLIHAVSVCDREGVCLPATRFEYSDDSADVQVDFGGQNVGQVVLAEEERQSLAASDFNGDGLADLAWLSNNPQPFEYDGETHTLNSALQVVYSEGQGNYSEVHQLNVEAEDYGLRIADTDGDGLAEPVLLGGGFQRTDFANFRLFEALRVNVAESGALYTTRIARTGSSPQGFGGCDVDEWGGAEVCHFTQVLDTVFLDVDGDSSEELVACTRLTSNHADYDDYAYWRVVEGDSVGVDPGPAEGAVVFGAGVGSGACAQECDQDTCNTRSSFIVLDANGDGRRDLLQVEDLLPADGAEWSDSPFVSDHYFYQAYGYGMPKEGVPQESGIALDTSIALRADFFQRYNHRNRYSRGVIAYWDHPFDEPPDDLLGPQPAGVFGHSADILGDFNGDGLTDVARFQPYSGGEPVDLFTHWGPEFEHACDDDASLPNFDARISFYLSRGNGQFVLGGSGSPFDSWSDYCDRFQNAVAADVDGDRIAEIVLPDVDGTLEVGNFVPATGLATWAPLAGGSDLFDRSTKRLFPIDLAGVGQSGLIVADGTGHSGGATGLEARGLEVPVDLLVRVVDGFGGQTDVHYGSLYDGETFEPLPCPAFHRSLAPTRPLVSRIEVPLETGEARFVNHRYRGACHDAPDYNFGSFQEHVVAAGVRPLPQGGAEFISSTTTTVRDDYTEIQGRELARGFVTHSVTDRWNPGDATFERTTSANTWTYIEDFFDRTGVQGLMFGIAQVPVGALVPLTSVTTRTSHAGGCVDWRGYLECEPTSEGTILSHSAFEESDHDAYGHAGLVATRVGTQCSEHEVDYEMAGELVLLDTRQSRAGVLTDLTAAPGLSYACDFQDGVSSTTSYEYEPTTLLVSNETRQAGVAEEHLEVDYGYDDGRVTSMTVSTPSSAGASGSTTNTRAWSVSYDLSGVFPETVENPLGHTTSTWWHPNLGLPLGVTDTNGVVSRTRYDGFGRETGAQVQLGYFGPVAAPASQMRYERVDPAGAAAGLPSPLREVAVSPEGAESLVEYDRDGRRARAEWDVDNDLRVFQEFARQWTGSGFRVLSSFPAAVGAAAGDNSSHEYDLLGRLVGATPVGTSLGLGEHVYTYSGNLAEHHAPDGGVWRKRVGPSGLLLATHDPEGTRTCFYYGALGRVRDVVVNPQSGTCDGALPANDTVRTTHTHYEYNTAGQATVRKLPGRSQETLAYNAFGEPWRVVDASGTTSTTRDALGRVVSRNDSGDGIAAYEWDSDPSCGWADGLLRRSTSADGVEREYFYDEFGRPSATELGVGSVSVRKDFRYDDFGRMAQLRHAGGPTVSYAFDPLGAPLAVSAAGQTLWEVDERDVSGRLSASSFGNGVEVETTITSGLLESSVTLAPNMTPAYPGAGTSTHEIDSVAVRYDVMGRPDYREIPHLGLLEDFTHDQIGRLTRSDAQRDGASVAGEQYDYWETGAIRSRSGIGAYTYGDAARPLSVTRAGNVEYTYDDDGRQLTRNSFAFDWNRRGRLKSVTETGGGGLSGGGDDIYYQYDADDVRVWKRVVETGGTNTTTVYDGDVEVEFAANGAVNSTYYVSGPGGVVASLKTEGTSNAYDVLYVHKNEFGTATVVTDESGAVVERKDYDAFGRERSVLWSGSVPAGDSELDLGFTGHRREESYGLIDMGGRHYDPHLGRFASPDPLVAAPLSSQGYDPFSYVLNDPLSYIDPSGFSPEDIDDGWFEDGEFYEFADVTTGGSGTSLDPWQIPGSADDGDAGNAPQPDVEPEEPGVIDLGEFEVKGDPESEAGDDSPDMMDLMGQLGWLEDEGGEAGGGDCAGSACIEMAFSGGANLDRGPADPDVDEINRAIMVGRANNKGLPAAEFSAELTFQIISFGLFPPVGRTVRLAPAAYYGGASGVARGTAGAMKPQLTPHSCGPACGSQLLREGGLDVFQSNLMRGFIARKGGISAEQLAWNMRQFQAGWRGGIVDGLSASQVKGLVSKGPFLANVAGGRHWVIVDGVRKGSVLIRDPAGGVARSMKMTDFLKATMEVVWRP